jgi:uncharacterized protein YlzI (FlbEa/FlbD family)
MKDRLFIMIKIVSIFLVVTLLSGCTLLDTAKDKAMSEMDAFMAKLENIEVGDSTVADEIGERDDDTEQTEKVNKVLDKIFELLASVIADLEKMPDVAIDDNGKEVDTREHKEAIIDMLESLKEELGKVRTEQNVLSVARALGLFSDILAGIEKAPGIIKESESVNNLVGILKQIGGGSE